MLALCDARQRTANTYFPMYREVAWSFPAVHAAFLRRLLSTSAPPPVLAVPAVCYTDEWSPEIEVWDMADRHSAVAVMPPPQPTLAWSTPRQPVALPTIEALLRGSFQMGSAIVTGSDPPVSVVLFGDGDDEIELGAAPRNRHIPFACERSPLLPPLDTEKKGTSSPAA